ncbi:MAG: PcfJ domain-containing protein [Bacteroidaceae bacterium]|nr:PcfJ domain-containing protein [Bacteroidaceae bacterium]
MRPLTQKALQWVSDKHDALALYSKGGRVWCTRCGHIENVLPKILALDIETGFRCPCCGKVLKMRHDAYSRYNNSYVFAVVAQVVKGWQVFRVVESRITVVFGAPATITQREVWQAWISPQGREVLLSRKYYRSPYSFQWYYDTPIECPRRHNATATGYFALPDTFCTMNGAFYPHGKISAALRLRGFSSKLCSFDALGCSLRLFSPHMETLAKTQPALFAYLVRRGDFETPYFHAVKVCNRNGYKIADPSLWLDMCDSIAAIGADTHNAHYVCPDDLNAAHDIATRRHAAMLRKKAAQEAEKRIAEDNKLYKEAKKPFFDIEIAADGLRLIVLPDVEAFRQEGKALSHCVYSNRYFARQDALILSARDEENNPVETIEVSLKTFEIVQSRGRSNQPSSRHAEIVDIVKRNMNLIKERATL